MPYRRTAPEPLQDLSVLQREINQLFLKLQELDSSSRPQGLAWSPPADVFECRGNLVVEVEVPGLQADSLKLTARDGVLLVSGERRERRPSGVVAFHCMERPHGRFTREIPIDRALDVRAAKARLEKGLLTVTIPRLKDRRGRETVIPVEREE
jgi:HSP20 family protein